MKPAIAPLSPAVADQLRRLGVMLVYLYGSAALGRSNRLSDIDVGVVLHDPTILSHRAHRADLSAAIEDCLTPALTPKYTRELDLVLLQRASPVLQFQAINAGSPLFVADPIARADYEAAVTRAYLDVKPMVEAHYQAVLERAT